MNTYIYRYYDSTEGVMEGSLSALNMNIAACVVLAQNRRHARHSVREAELSVIGHDELRDYQKNGYFALSVKLAGTKKRKSKLIML